MLMLLPGVVATGHADHIAGSRPTEHGRTCPCIHVALNLPRPCPAWPVAVGLPPGVSLLISGAADNTVRVWAVATPPSNPKTPGSDRYGTAAAAPAAVLTSEASSSAMLPWHCLAVLEGHTAPVSSLACYPLPTEEGEGFLVVSTAGDSNVHIWRCATSRSAIPSSDAAFTVGSGGLSSSPDSDNAVAAYGQSSWTLEQTLPVGTHIQQVGAQ